MQSPGRRVRLGLLTLMALGVSAAFWSPFAARIAQAYEAGSVLAFSDYARTPEYLDYNRQVLDGTMGERVAAIQSIVPAGEPFIGWINAPFLFDYARNPVVDIDQAGLTTKWAKFPDARYVLWEYSGFATRTPRDYLDQQNGPGRHERFIAIRALDVARLLVRAANEGEVLHNDGRFVVFRLSAGLQEMAVSP